MVPTFAPADHAPAPIVPNLGGPRLAHPQLVVITFADDPNRATLEAHARWLVGSTWLSTVGAEYGIGAGSILLNVERADNAPDTITSMDAQAAPSGATDSCTWSRLGARPSTRRSRSSSPCAERVVVALMGGRTR